MSRSRGATSYVLILLLSLNLWLNACPVQAQPEVSPEATLIIRLKALAYRGLLWGQ